MMNLTWMVFAIVLYIFILRLWLQFFHAPYNNPVCQFVIRFTNPLVKPLQKILPGIKGFDLAILVSFLIIAIIKFMLLGWVTLGAFSISGVLIQAALDFVDKNIEFFFILVLVRALASWFAPSTSAPATQLLYILTEPLLTRVRKYIPPLGQIDLAPAIILIVLCLINYWLETVLQHSAIFLR